MKCTDHVHEEFDDRLFPRDSIDLNLRCKLQ